MNMLDLMNKLTQLSEATKDTGKGKIHTADPGGYGRKEDEDEAGEDGKKKKAKPADAPRGRGRPKKDADSSGEVKKYDFTAFGAPAKGKDVKLPKWDKSKTSKHTPMKDAEKSEKKKEKSSLKDWIEHYEILALNEAEQIQIKPASQMPKKPGQTSVGAKPGQPAPVAGATPANTQVIAQGDKTLGTVNNPALAQQIKQSIGKGEMTLMPDQAMAEGLDPELRSRLDSLISDYEDATDPSDYSSYNDPEEIIATIRKEFGDKIASQVEDGSDKMHFPRQGHSTRYDPLSWKKPVDRITKAGKMYKQDSDYLKNTIKSRYNLSGKSATEGVAEGSNRKSYASIQDGGANDERHDLDPSDWYIVKDGAMYKRSIYPKQHDAARAAGYSPTKDEARKQAGSQGVSEASTINGKVQDPKSKVWKQTGLSKEAAEQKYGKENVKVTKGGLRNGSDMVEVNVPLGEAKKVTPKTKLPTTRHQMVSEDNTLPESELYHALIKFLKAGQAGQMKEWDQEYEQEVIKVLNLLKQGHLQQAIDHVQDVQGWIGMESGALDELADWWMRKNLKKSFWDMCNNIISKHKLTLSEDKQVNELSKDTLQKYAGAGLGAGRNPKVLEKMRTSGKKGLGESMEHRLKAAHHRGKAHALARESYNCKYEDMDESRCYHEGFKEGLDECYGQGVMDEGWMGGALGAVGGALLGGPVGAAIGGGIGGAMEEGLGGGVLGALAGGALTKTPGGVMTGARIGSGLQDAFAGDDEVEEGNAFTGALAHTPQGDQFKVGGRTYTDKSSIEESPWSMNEDAQLKDWDSTLSSLLKEGFNVTSSTGLGGPDSVSINATDADAQELLAIVRQAGLGVFGGDEAQSQDSPAQSSDYGAPQAGGEPMTMDAGGEQGGEESHDGMLALMKKLSGLSGSSEDYADEEGEGSEQDEAACSTCGSSPCGCEAVEEDETMDQREFEVSEDNGDNEEEQSEVSSDATRDAALAAADSQNVDEDAEEESAEAEESAEEAEDELEESYANSDDDGFQADIEFMTNAITGGLNKQKSTGQSTIPVVASQENRLGNPMRESTDLLSDWKKLSGI